MFGHAGTRVWAGYSAHIVAGIAGKGQGQRWCSYVRCTGATSGWRPCSVVFFI